MSLEITQREREGVFLLDFEGRIVTGPESAHFRETIQQISQLETPKVVLNLGGVDYIDSTGLGAIVLCATTLRKVSGVAKLLNLNRRTIELLVATKLATIFEIFTDEQDAINSFFPGREIKRFDILDFVKQQKDK